MSIWKISLSILLLICVVVFAFFWNEARKEVVFLCGNFSQGVTQSSVLKQLNTLHFSQFSVKETGTGRLIVMDSKLNFGFYQCIIDINTQGRVIQSRVE